MKVLGTHVAPSRYSVSRTSVIGAVELSPNGERVVLRVGRLAEDGNTWEQTEHVVLTHEEVDTLLTEIQAVRDPSR